MDELGEAISAGTKERAERLTVSIALATYNGERFLLEQLESLARQSVLPDELIISDDGSTDGTLEILKSFALSAPFDVRILSNSETLGYRRNFLNAAYACRCEIVFFCDQDDVWDESKIALMRDPFLNPGIVMAYHHVHRIDEFGNPAGSIYEAFPNGPWQHVRGMSMAFRRCLLVRPDVYLQSIDYFHPESNMAHDQWVKLLASAFGLIVVVDRILIGYRQHQANVYGAAASQTRASFAERLRTRIKDRAESFELLAENCRSNASIFGDLSRDRDLTEDWRDKAQFAAQRFEELGLLYVLRCRIYKAPWLATRFRSFCKLFRLGAYTRTRYWTFGPRGAMRDVLLGVLVGPLVTQLGAEKVLGDLNCRRNSQSNSTRPFSIS